MMDVFERRDSKSTLNSSLAAELVKQNATQNNLNLDGSQTIHVGDVINNFYTPPSSDGTKSDSFNGSISDSDVTLVRKDQTSNKASGFIRRKYWIGIIVLVVAATIVGLSLYYALNDMSEENPGTTAGTLTETMPATTTQPESTPTDPTEPITESLINFIGRDNWLRGDVRNLTLPIKRIIIGHTGDENASCFSEQDCKLRVKMMRWNNIGLNDLPHNFYIGGDGSVIEGRGLRCEGEHTANVDGSNFNDIGISVAFIGTFNETEPLDKQIEGFDNFTLQYINDGVLVADYKIFLQDHLAKPKISANALLQVVENFTNYYPISNIYRRDEWGAQAAKGDKSLLSSPAKRVMIAHTAINKLCTTVSSCVTSVRNQQEIKSPMGDVPDNFLLGSNGLIFEGRGFHRAALNDSTRGPEVDYISISLIGYFNLVPPSEELLNATLKFFDDAVMLGKLSPDYRINVLSDFGAGTSPGTAFVEIIKRNWSRYSAT